MIRLEPLTGHHDRNGFDCGVEALDVWLKQTALQHQGKGISRSFVAVPADESAVQSWAESGYPVQALSILGFYALTSAFVLTEDLPAPAGQALPAADPGHSARAPGHTIRYAGPRLGAGCCWPMQ
jgi:hypothetical protein